MIDWGGLIKGQIVLKRRLSKKAVKTLPKYLPSGQSYYIPKQEGRVKNVGLWMSAGLVKKRTSRSFTLSRKRDRERELWLWEVP